jgi:hypothetical protein
MSANEAGPNLDRATFQKLAVASLIPALAAVPAAVEAMKPPPPTPTPTPYAFSEEDFEKLLEALVSGITKILSDIEPMIQAHDRCPPYKQPKNCPAFHDAIKNLKDFSNTASQKSY